jgi:syntaxin 16
LRLAYSLVVLTPRAAEILAERDKQIRQIAQSISQVVEIFRDLNTMVIEQGTLLDRIDHNIQTAEVHTRQAVTELKDANKQAKSATGKYCIMLMCLAVTCLLLLVLFKLGYKLVL